MPAAMGGAARGWEWDGGAYNDGDKLPDRKLAAALWRFDFSSGAFDPGERWWNLIIPHWAPAATFAVLPVIWWRLRRNHRRGSRACPECGYDLHGTPFAGGSKTCPECGDSSPPRGAGL
jgi:hypothetical protein